MKREQKIWIILFICYIASLSKTISDYFFTTDAELKIAFLIGQIIWPFIGSIICVLIFPILVSAGFLRLKKKLWKKYEDSFLNLNDRALDVKKLFKRLIKIFLLTMGLSATLLGSGIIDPLWFTKASRISDYAVNGIQNPIYIPEVLVGFGFLILPFIIGLWSIGWIFEDSGLMHHKFPPREDMKFYEIEPIHFKYNALIDSYAGISAILFYISTIIYYMTYATGETAMGNGFFIFALSIFYMFGSVPAYFLYTYVSKKYGRNYLRKNLQEIKILRKEDLQKV